MAQKNNPNNQIVYLISDQSADVSYLYSYLTIQAIEEQATSLRFQIIQLSSNHQLDLYIFPKNRQIKPYCSLYTEILPFPDLIIYAVGPQSSIQENTQWLNLFEKNNKYRIVFFSSSKTYLERQQILIKINSLFIRDPTQHVMFPLISHEDIDNCFYNLNSKGISMNYYDRMIPAFSKLKWAWKKIINRKPASQQESLI